MPSCPRCGRTVVEEATYCSRCGERLPPDGPRRRQARKTVTILFADVSGFTALGEQLDPESLQHVMSRYFTAMTKVVERHGGTVEKFIGDAVMALFGVPAVHEDDAERATRAALEMCRALETLNDEELIARWDVRLRTHTGINTGEVVVGVSPDGEPLTYGDAVNVAQRLESAAAPGEILVGAATARLVHAVAHLAPLEPLELKGKSEPVEAWRLEGMVSPDSIPAGPSRELVGRDAELARLRAVVAGVASARRPAMVTVTGPAGIGKSRLARELVTGVSDRAAVVVGRCAPYGEGVTYQPVAQIVRQLAGRPDQSAIASVAGSGAERRRIAERVARLAGFAPGAVAVEEAHWAFRRLLEIRAAERPLIVVVDDVHWAEPPLLDLLQHAVTFAADVPLLFVCLARQDLLDRRPTWGDAGGRATIVPLRPLEAPDAEALLAQLTTAGDLPADERDRLLATAEGNPFFLEQMVAHRSGPGGVASRMPGTVQALLAARIDALAPAERAVIDRASIEGRSFHRSAVADLLPEAERAGVDDALDALTAHQLVRPGLGELPGEAGYRFAHVLVRDVAYELLPKATRAELHERYASWLDRHAAATHGELVGYHLEQAHRWHAELLPGAEDERLAVGARAARRLAPAGRAALQRGDLRAGVSLLERSAALLPADDPSRAALLPELGLALVQLGRLPQAEDVLIGASRDAAGRGDGLAEAHARTAELFALVQMDPTAATEEVADRFTALRRTFAEARDDLGLARLWRARALVHWLEGRTARAEEAWVRGVRHARRAGDDQGRADALCWLASAAGAGPMPVAEGIRRCEAIIEQLSADRHSQALSTRPLATLHAMAGRIDTARGLLVRAHAIEAELGVGMNAAGGQDDALVELLGADPAAAETALRRGYADLQEMGERALLATTAAMLGQALLAQGRDDEADAFVRVAEEAAAPDDLSAQIVARSVRAQLLAGRDLHDDADRLTADAVRLAARTDWLTDHADALMVRGDVLRRAGRMDEATAAVRRALELYDRKGNAIGAGNARRALADVVRT
ncbi:MAG: hypothetical protein QOD81_2359 [Solirubrobacteraceae bacterium]|nr:hypothetical protein [Solirubrobacteraceae bacterium]